MASTSSSSQLAPKLNKQGRAKLAKDTVNNMIPHILKSNKRAQEGVNNSKLIHYSTIQEPPKPTSATALASGESSMSSEVPLHNPVPKVTVIQSDTYDAANVLLKSNTANRVAVLNMASALHPGGGFLNGSVAQEESLCGRSTLFPSLHDHFYRIPAAAGIYTPDVLVFRAADQSELLKSEQYFVDVISVAAPKHPDVVAGRDGKMVYEAEKDQEAMVLKIRLIFQIAKQKGIKYLILGALGCGAYKNPPEEVAKIFKRVIFGDRKRGSVVGVEEVVFAIFDDGENLRVFREVFQDSSVEA